MSQSDNSSLTIDLSDLIVEQVSACLVRFAGERSLARILWEPDSRFTGHGDARCCLVVCMYRAWRRNDYLVGYMELYRMKQK